MNLPTPQTVSSGAKQLFERESQHAQQAQTLSDGRVFKGNSKLFSLDPRSKL